MIETCRLCLRTEKRMRPIFGRTEVSRRIRSRILDCCLVQLVEDAALPGQICEKCESKLTALHEFRKQCRESELTLRKSYDVTFTESTASYKATRDASVQTESIIIPLDRSLSPGRYVDSGPERLDEREDESIESKTQSSNHQVNGQICDEEKLSLEPVQIREEGIGGQQDRNTGLHEKPYLCDLCSKTFASKSGLRFHLKSHSGSKPHLCQFCDKGFAIPSYKKRHERIHAGDKRFVCHICSAAFASSNGFKYHLRSHTGEANYRCETCGKCFARCKYLKEHLFTHTGERPFACKICGSAYANSGSLFVHEKKCKLRYDRPPEDRTAKDGLA